MEGGLDASMVNGRKKRLSPWPRVLVLLGLERDRLQSRAVEDRHRGCERDRWILLLRHQLFEPLQRCG
jgi:hypothetical protein